MFVLLRNSILETLNISSSYDKVLLYTKLLISLSESLALKSLATIVAIKLSL